MSLIAMLDLQKYPQFSKGISLFQTKSFEPAQKFFVPEAETPSYRLAGGTPTLTDSLADKVGAKNIRLNTRVTGLRNTEDTMTLETVNGEVFKADKVIVCIPPQLVASQNKFSPELPKPVREVPPTVQT